MAAIARKIRSIFGLGAPLAACLAVVAWPGSEAAAEAPTDPISRVLQNILPQSPPTLAEQTTRFEILVPDQSDFTVQAFSSPTNRVVVEIPATRMALPDHDAVTRKGGLIKSFRAGLSAPGRSRVVIEVAEPVVVHKREIAKTQGGNAHAITIDLVPATAVTRAAHRGAAPFPPPSGLGASGIQPPLPAPAVRPEERFAKAWKPVIVIDPGHGGHDTGARKFGTVEKDVVLAFSKELREQLEANGRYKVLMTRETDEFISLDGRREFAEKNNAALFIAVHADYASRTAARGATIYSLRDSVADRLRSSAKGEVKSAVLSKGELQAVRRTAGDGNTVRKILSDLAAREVDMTQQRTQLFSRTVIEKMGTTTELRGQPHRSAAFRVLKTAKVPSVLIELAYVSNQRDARLLKSETWRKRVAGSIMDSIDKYFANMRRTSTVAAND
ncbi:MAG: hypothetical protein RLZ98_1539 [Pseudomonadota bacterium]|jgi:N-acetylmuramoyl-L-alanine amidase